MGDGLVTLFVCGDVMTGRGVDQILPQPGNPELWERYAGDARSYVHLAERANGKIPRPAPFGWPQVHPGLFLSMLNEPERARPPCPRCLIPCQPVSPSRCTSPLSCRMFYYSARNAKALSRLGEGL